ncbi:DoxX family protein [Paracoccus sp. SCSIO 75233]|uniref:DoxX family protein n=1 Tax=Paracoccus sp. SCSIO 75233 TaxID=3017782 RepID=UPI0022F08B70|nr:DoxX family protein [Paracoccus sp. SCSIO 75233]WBU54628.1 DoxX family protein [Paracoccus sp. SCSIO 75233]
MKYKTLNALAPQMRSVLRMVSAAVFFAHGSQKIIGFPASDRAFPEIFSRFWFAGVLELIGGALLFVGLFSRPVAFVLSGLMAFAYWMAHAPRHWVPALNGGDAAILFCFIFLYLVFAGPGPWSLDARAGRDR